MEAFLDEALGGRVKPIAGGRAPTSSAVVHVTGAGPLKEAATC
jgi:hypothetical protein